MWNLTFSGPVLCSQQHPVIIPVVYLMVYSLGRLVERVRDAISSTEWHAIAAPNYRQLLDA